MIKRYFDYFGKFVLGAMVIVLAIMMVAVYISEEPEEKEVNVAAAFMVEGFTSAYGEFETSVELGNIYYDDGEKNKFLKEIAEVLGINSLGTYECSRSNDITVCGYRVLGEKAKVYLDFYTEEKNSSLNVLQLKQYVKVKIYVSDSVNSILYYKEKLDEYFYSKKLNNTSKISVCGQIDRLLGEKEKKNIASQFIDKLSGNVVSSHIDDDNFAVYGFTKHFNNYIVYGDKKVNLTLIISEDKDKNVTNVYMATPTV